MANPGRTNLTDVLYEFSRRDRPDCMFPERAALTAYHKGCRCGMCVAFQSEYQRLWKSGNYESRRIGGRPAGLKREGWPSYVCIKCGDTKRAAFVPKSSICSGCIERLGSIGKRIRAAGLNQEQARTLLEKIKCCVCLMELNSFTAVFDHNHKISNRTNAESFRGVLCAPCNSRLGALERLIDLDLLEASLQYLKRTQL